LGVRGKVFLAVVVGSSRGGCCEKLPEASPMSDRASATGSQMDPLLAKAQPIGNGGSASGIA